MRRYFSKTAAKQARRVSRKCHQIEQHRLREAQRLEQEMLERNKERYRSGL